MVESTGGRTSQILGIAYLAVRVLAEFATESGFTLASPIDILLAPLGLLAIALIVVPWIRESRAR